MSADFPELGGRPQSKVVPVYVDADSFYSSESDSEDDKDGDFTTFSDPDDEFFIKPTSRRSHVSAGTREQRARNQQAAKYSRRRKNNSDDDSDDGDFIATFKHNSYSSITSQRKRKIVEDDSFVSSFSVEDIAKSEDISEDEVIKMLSENKKPSIEDILAVQINEETSERKYFVKFHNQPIAHAVFLTPEEVSEHPGGQSHLSNFISTEEIEGLKKSIEMPDLYVLGNADEDSRPPVERVIGYDDDTHLYLVKWQDKSYEYASWIADVNDEKQLNLFKQRNIANKSTPIAVSKACKPYGEDPGCLPLPNYKNGHKLRSYQVEALNWMRAAYHIGQNAILADEMGLGKTVMCIALLIDIIQNCGHDGPFLIVAPLSTLPNWQREFENWSNIDAIVFHGRQQDRELIAEYELFLKPPRQDVTKFQVLLTNIETVQKSIDLIQKIKWHLVIIDEAHKLKNINSRIYNMMFSLQMEHVLLMTGTPIQNNINEIYALMHFIAPLKFPSLEEFKREHGNISSAEDVSKLQATLRPYMLRRKKCDVEASIGIKEETIVEVELTRTQKFYYRLLIGKKSHELTTHKSHALSQDLNNLAMHLRKVCNHPYLFKGVEDEIKKPGEDPYEAMINASGKLVFVDKLLAKLRPKGNKILIFSQMVKILNILEDFLDYRNYPYVRLDGSVVGEDRQAAIDKFSDPNSDVFVFLLCTKAGGVGLNLTAADTVIIYDSDWNPQNDLQAEARCHRIGQTKDVKIYRLITRGTYEQEMFARASMKLGLDQAILDSGQNSNADMTPKEIETLIKRGAYYVFNEDETAADEFVAEDVDQILEKHTKTLTKSAADRESVFSKASFVVDKDGAKIDFNDENFWDRVIPENLRNQKEEEKPLPPRRSRSIPSYNEAELEKALKPAPEFSWNVKTRDIILKALLSLGYGRWGDMLSKTQLKTDSKKIQDGCTVLIFLIAKNLSDGGEFLSEIVGIDEIELTKPQKKIKQCSSFTNHNFLNILAQDAEEHATRLRQLHAINQWHSQGGKIVRFELGDDAPEGWTHKLDQKLLKAVWRNGFGNWKPVLKDECYSKFQNKELSDRLIFISNALVTLYNEEADEDDESSSFPDLKPTEMRMLINILTDYGLPGDESDAWLKYAEFFAGIENYQELVKLIIQCVRVIAFYDSNLPTNRLRKWLNSILPHSDVLAASISQSQAIHIKENIDYVTRLNIYNKKVLPTLKPVKDLPRVFVPSTWVVGENDIKLIKNVCENQFSNLYDFVLNDISDQFTEQQLNTFTNNLKYYQRHTQHKHCKGDLSFYFEDYSLKDRIDDFINQNGGWKGIPVIIDLPEDKVGTISLPLTIGEIVIESTGDGEFFLCNGYICRVGLTSTVRFGKTKYSCTVESPTKFVIKRGEKYVFEGETPFDAWRAADSDFDQSPEEYFGMSCDPIIAFYDKECTPEIREKNGIVDYVPPTIITFPSQGKR